MTSRLLLIDDDARLAAMVGDYLRGAGFEVDHAGTLASGREHLASTPFDALVLDLMLPDGDGLDLCRELRASPRTRHLPLLMLTARGEPLDRIVGLELGADDYLPKPFNPRELVARINAVLRRVQEGGPPAAPTAEAETVVFGPYALNLATRSMTRDDKPVALTSGEFSVLKVLVRHPSKPLSRDKLMEMARGREYDVFDRAIDVQISRLRKLIEADPANPRYIQTVWGFGYVFVPD